MPPAVAEARELRLAAARVVLDRELADLKLLLGGADHHLGGELHAGRAEVERAAERRGAARACRSARRRRPVLNSTLRKPGQQRVADVAVVPGHRARVDVLHPVADHHVGAALQFGEEVRGSPRSRRSDRHRPSGCIRPGRQRDRPGTRSRSPARARSTTWAPAASASAPLPSLDPLSATITSPAMLLASRACRAPRTHSSIVPASSRHGITIDSRTAACVPAGVGVVGRHVLDRACSGRSASSGRHQSERARRLWRHDVSHPTESTPNGRLPNSTKC